MNLCYIKTTRTQHLKEYSSSLALHFHCMMVEKKKIKIDAREPEIVLYLINTSTTTSAEWWVLGAQIKWTASSADAVVVHRCSKEQSRQMPEMK